MEISFIERAIINRAFASIASEDVNPSKVVTVDHTVFITILYMNKFERNFNKSATRSGENLFIPWRISPYIHEQFLQHKKDL